MVGLIPRRGTSLCCRCGQKQTNKKGEAKVLVQANVRMEFPLTGMEKTAGEAVLRRRWEFGVALAGFVLGQCQYNAGSMCPDFV